MKTILSIIINLAAVSAGFGDFVKSPVAFGNTEGGGPFLTDRSIADSIRYQQVYRASDFTSFGSPLRITELRFEQVAGPNDNTLSNVQIRLSTTPRNPDALSSIFAENVGASETVVFSGSLRLFGSGGFTTRIPLQTPFVFDPLAGNLLMDVSNFSTLSIFGGRRTLRAEDTFGDSVSGVVALDVNAASGFVGTGGLVTLFEVTPIPEPSTVMLLSVGLGGLLLVLSRRANKS